MSSTVLSMELGTLGGDFFHIYFVCMLRFVHLLRWISFLLLYDDLGKRFSPDDVSWGISLLCNVEFIFIWTLV